MHVPCQSGQEGRLAEEVPADLMVHARSNELLISANQISAEGHGSNIHKATILTWVITQFWGGKNVWVGSDGYSKNWLDMRPVKVLPNV